MSTASMSRAGLGSGQEYPVDLWSSVVGLGNTLIRGVSLLVSPYDLSPMEFALMRVFIQQEVWTSSELAGVLPVKRARISRMVTKLVNRGLMSRRRPRADRRVVMLTLTDEGGALALALHHQVKLLEDRLTQGIDQEEMSSFLSTAWRISANFAELDRSRE